MLALSSALASCHFSSSFCHTVQVDPSGRGTREKNQKLWACLREVRQAQGMPKARRSQKREYLPEITNEQEDLQDFTY